MATSRRRREARQARRQDDTKTVPPSRISLPAARPANRATSKVAQARRELQAAIPDVVYTPPAKPERRITRRASRAPAARQQPKASALPRAGTSRSDPPRDQLDMRPLPRCKPRPSGGKGDGNSRPFVPWCRD